MAHNTTTDCILNWIGWPWVLNCCLLFTLQAACKFATSIINRQKSKVWENPKYHILSTSESINFQVKIKRFSLVEDLKIFTCYLQQVHLKNLLNSQSSRLWPQRLFRNALVCLQVINERPLSAWTMNPMRTDATQNGNVRNSKCLEFSLLHAD